MVIDLEKERYRVTLEYIASCPDEAIGFPSAAKDMRDRAKKAIAPSPIASQETVE